MVVSSSDDVYTLEPATGAKECGIECEVLHKKRIIEHSREHSTAKHRNASSYSIAQVLAAAAAAGLLACINTL